MAQITNGAFNNDGEGWEQGSAGAPYDGRYVWDEADNDPICSQTISGLTEGQAYYLIWKQEVAEGDHVKVILGSTIGAEQTDALAVDEIVATGATLPLQFRGYGGNGSGWIDDVAIVEVPT